MHAPSSVPSDHIFAIDYQLSGSMEHNALLKGRGALTVQTAPVRYVFTGDRRATFSKESLELSFAPDQIWNVVVRDRAVFFTTNHAGIRKPDKPFVFFCASTEEARLVASLLPARVDSDFTAERDFASQLARLPRPSHPAFSATNLIIAANVAVFVVMGFLGAGWFEVADHMPYVLYGANQGAATTGGEWWRLLTSMFMHYGLLHLALNMWALFNAGYFLERLQGRALYSLTYLASGICGGFASIWWHGDKTWSAGASGAVFGVFAAILGYMLRQKQAIPRTIFQSLMRSSLVFAGYNIFFGLAARGIDNAAHLGGAAGGFILGWLLAMPLDPQRRRQLLAPRFVMGCTTLVVLCAIGVAVTPRFDYHIRNTLALATIDKRFTEREAELITTHSAALAAIQGGEDGTAHAAWIEKKLIPFHAERAAALRGLALKPGFIETEIRDINARYDEFTVEVLKNFVAALRRGDPDALKVYHLESERAQAEINQFNAQHRAP